MTAKYITIGKIGSPYGVKGWVKLYSYAEPSEQILQYHPLEIYLAGQWQTLDIADSHVRPNDIVIQVAGCNDRDHAMRYTNCELRVDAAQLTTLTDDEYYWHELTGLTVINREGDTLGIVDDLMETGSNDVLIVKHPDEKDLLIPYLPGQFVDRVDLDAQQMIVDWQREYGE